MNPFSKRPWLWVVVAFLLLIAAWTILIKIAVNHAPEKVPLETEAAAKALEETNS